MIFNDHVWIGNMTPETQNLSFTAILPGPDGSCRPASELMTEDELIQYLRIKEVSKARDHHNVVENLKRMRDLPRIHICGKPLYPLKAIQVWIEKNTKWEQ